MNFSIGRTDKGKLFVEKPLMKGAIPDYKAMHEKLLEDLWNERITTEFQATRLKRAQTDNGTLRAENENLRKEHLSLRLLLVEIQNHFGHKLLPKALKEKIASRVS